MTIKKVMEFLQKFDPDDELVVLSCEWSDEKGQGTDSAIRIFDDKYGMQDLKWEEFEPWDDED